jgi:hypothetical protein
MAESYPAAASAALSGAAIQAERGLMIDGGLGRLLAFCSGMRSLAFWWTGLTWSE